MTTVLSLIDSIQAGIRGPDEIEVSIAQVQQFINDAAQEARSSGWLLPLEDDESITFASNTYEYNVPASFAYVYMLRIENDTRSRPRSAAIIAVAVAIGSAPIVIPPTASTSGGIRANIAAPTRRAPWPDNVV